jgi:drug/metabolite transporter (DMT)-like permease
MKHTAAGNHYLKGILFAILAAMIWGGNFIIARAVNEDISPVALAFYRWLTAVICLLPFAWKHIVPALRYVKTNKLYFFFTALSGITLFNTFVYVAGKTSSAINLALIGTTSSPIMAVILAHFFLKESIQWRRIAGMMLCITGILFLLGRGHFNNLLNMHFTAGDGWILLAALSFAVYNTLANKKPAGITSIGFLFIVFAAGTLLLLPAFMIDYFYSKPVHWSWGVTGSVFYLGIGTSVIAFLLWNTAIKELGAGRAALFGNLIPVFSSVGAVIILSEQVKWIQLASFAFIVMGLVIDNSHLLFRKQTKRT